MKRRRLESINRLTHKARYEAGYKLNKDVKEWQAADRLGVYEDTGLTPPEVQELKERDTKKNIRADKVTSIGKFGNCPRCGRRLWNEDCTTFCGSCGQRLKWEDE